VTIEVFSPTRLVKRFGFYRSTL